MILLSGQIGNTESELKKLAEENPDLQEAYIAKQKRLKVSKPGCLQLTSTVCITCSTFLNKRFPEYLLLNITSHQYIYYLWLMVLLLEIIFLY